MASHTIGLGKEEPSMREEWMEKVNTAIDFKLLISIDLEAVNLILRILLN